MDLNKLADITYENDGVNPCSIYLQPIEQLVEGEKYNGRYWCIQGNCNGENCTAQKFKECIQTYIKDSVH
jgi:hypothetical protein